MASERCGDGKTRTPRRNARARRKRRSLAQQDRPHEQDRDVEHRDMRVMSFVSASKPIQRSGHDRKASTGTTDRRTASAAGRESNGLPNAWCSSRHRRERPGSRADGVVVSAPGDGSPGLSWGEDSGERRRHVRPPFLPEPRQQSAGGAIVTSSYDGVAALPGAVHRLARARRAAGRSRQPAIARVVHDQNGRRRAREGHRRNSSPRSGPAARSAESSGQLTDAGPG